MTAESETNRPNDFGFAGGATTPEPGSDRDRADQSDRADRAEAERVAVPADDLTGAVSAAVENAAQGDEADR